MKFLSLHPRIAPAAAGDRWDRPSPGEFLRVGFQPGRAQVFNFAEHSLGKEDGVGVILLEDIQSALEFHQLGALGGNLRFYATVSVCKFFPVGCAGLGDSRLLFIQPPAGLQNIPARFGCVDGVKRAVFRGLELGDLGGVLLFLRHFRFGPVCLVQAAGEYCPAPC